MKRFFRFFLFLMVATVVLCGVTSWWMLDYALMPNGNEEAKDIAGSWEEMERTRPRVKAWHDSLTAIRALRDTFITATDGTRLHAYYILHDSARHTALLLHGYGKNAISMMHLARMYEQELGMNVLLPDLRYAGLSEGTHIQMGWRDREDVSRWIRLSAPLFGLEERVKGTRGEFNHTYDLPLSRTLIVHGISMGAATTMFVAGEKQTSYVTGYIEDCGYTSVWDMFARELRAQFSLTEYPLLYTSSWLCQLRHGWNFQEADARRSLHHCFRPMLFIHGTADTYVPTEMVHRLYAAKPGKKTLWLVPDVKHAASYDKYPEEYRRRVSAFLRTLPAFSVADGKETATATP